jgi:hypothetical protein
VKYGELLEWLSNASSQERLCCIDLIRSVLNMRNNTRAYLDFGVIYIT